ncbi:MAG: twin-arginine translocation signal domain-containing protein, partial [Candidatus Faecalibacterium intestinavium]|nr:twin-arginine translocation signal domain-containing protein [Candidatus Faecalibacterium intestinavium]
MKRISRRSFLAVCGAAAVTGACLLYTSP